MTQDLSLGYGLKACLTNKRLCLLYPILVTFGVLYLCEQYSGYPNRSTVPLGQGGLRPPPCRHEDGVSTEGVVSPLRPTWNWTDIFSFVPNGLTRCPDLYKNTDKEAPFPEPFQREYDLFREKLISVGGVREGTSAFFVEEVITYYHIVRAPFVRTVCETGFNGGHSSFMWLQANPNTTVYSFDIGKHGYARPMAEYLQQRFPGRLTVTWGDSTTSLPAFHKANPAVKCDVISIDGGHTNAVCLADYINFRPMASVDSVIILDNYPDGRVSWLKKLGDVWESAKKEGQIIEIFQCNYRPEKPQGFSVGRLNPYFIT